MRSLCIYIVLDTSIVLLNPTPPSTKPTISTSIAKMSTKMWLLVVIASALTLTPTHAQNPAPQTNKNPYPHTAVAKIDNGASVKGTIEFVKVPKEQRPAEASHFAPNRPLTSVTVKLTGLESGKDFSYFIYEKPITGTDCTQAGGQWNPKKWDTKDPNYRCDPKRPSRCVAGDLSAKHGMLKGNGPTVTAPPLYYDPSLRLTYSEKGILGKSVVIHDPTGNPVACANIIDPTAPAS
ncbi:hypothetical protein PSTT_10520 [Puccinia striiformis]|uniref:Superoxide dismutase copper/zinc binding domain-containing protein n=2 Tax=Puccinia striiformis TaxID=27350 RepID=A0A2S4V3Y8_9BASI|nr:hypothetical protein PSTT_10520 [Puccinia striiformis]